jgi:hypothetical protein
MPKVPKVEVRLRRIDYIKRKKQGMHLYSLTDFWFSCRKDQAFIIMMERSDATILGTLGILGILF